MVVSMIQFHEADLVGIQEALQDQMDDFVDLLPEFGWMGVGRDDGKGAGEYAAIFYRLYFWQQKCESGAARHAIGSLERQVSFRPSSRAGRVGFLSTRLESY